MLAKISPFSILLIFLYAVIAFCDFYAIENASHLRVYSKPLLMISLSVAFLSSLESIGGRLKWIFFVALVFAFLGDVFLLGEGFFVFGLGSFLIMQLIYIYLFVKGQNYYGRREWIFVALLAVVVAISNYLLLPHVQNMMIPVILYTAAISMMSFFAYTRDMTTPGYWTIWTGTLFFIISDTVLAFNLFVGEIILGGVIVMATYVLAQFCIASGYAHYLRSQHSSS